VTEVVRDRRAERFATTRGEIVEAAWRLAREHGLLVFTLRDVAAEVGMQAPSLYSYFASKNEIYDAMFADGATTFHDVQAAVRPGRSARASLMRGTKAFAAYCTEDPVRYQLLFQRTIPGFEPSAEAFAPAVAALDLVRVRLAALGLTEQRHLDLWTAMTSGLVAQQLANEPGGTRWTRLIEDAVDMYLAYHAGERT
jgi:AcrR family transcriptional regulator